MLSSGTVSALVLLVSASATMAGTVSAELRQKAEMICFDDASRLCANSLGDEGQILACMKGKRILLTSACRTVYDEVAQALKN